LVGSKVVLEELQGGGVLSRNPSRKGRKVFKL
jgi:hypothetical protein